LAREASARGRYGVSREHESASATFALIAMEDRSSPTKFRLHLEATPMHGVMRSRNAHFLRYVVSVALFALFGACGLAARGSAAWEHSEAAHVCGVGP
jgi:hypothetical protein